MPGSPQIIQTRMPLEKGMFVPLLPVPLYTVSKMRFCLALMCVALPCFCLAQNDEAYGKKIKEFTTETFFLPDLVDHLPASKTVPSPDKFLGHIVGAPNVLTRSEEHTSELQSH